MPNTATLEDVFNIDLDIAKAANIFAYYVGALFFLAYFLSLFVSSLHVRQDVSKISFLFFNFFSYP